MTLSKTIPEEIVGRALFVPGDHNEFEVVNGEMPNGDACLRIRGDLNPNYLAYQRGHTTPTKLQQWTDTIVSDTTGISMSFWIKVKRPYGAAPGGVLMSCKNFETLYVSGATGGSESNWARWWVLVSESSGLCVLTLRYRGNANAISDRATTGFTYNAWHLITFMVARVNGTTVTMGSYVDTLTGTVGNVSSGASPAPLSSSLITMLALGSYQASFGGCTADVHMGKWSFHDRPLTLAERTTMYDTMTA